MAVVGGADSRAAKVHYSVRDERDNHGKKGKSKLFH
jgi:hypothetical protein